ncbi:MAG: CRISPR-associated protein Cas4 [Halobacteriota archaeon]
MPTCSDLARATYCPRQLYYARRADDREPPADVVATRRLAFRYPELRRCDDETLTAEPIEVSPSAYRTALDRLAARDDWEALADPPNRMVRLTGKDCRGVAHKLLPGGSVGDDDDDPPTPVLVSPGRPPSQGVWKPQTVRAVAVAKALAWERNRSIPAVLVEYPAYGVVRRVRLTTRAKAAYRLALRTVRTLDGPPPRVQNREKCTACDYRTECGVRTRTLRSMLGL